MKKNRFRKTRDWAQEALCGAVIFVFALACSGLFFHTLHWYAERGVAMAEHTSSQDQMVAYERP